MKPFATRGSVDFYKLYAPEGDLFPLLSWVSDEPEWEIAAFRAPHASVVSAYQNLLSADASDALVAVHPSRSRQAFVLSLLTHRWTFVLYEMRRSSIAGSGNGRSILHAHCTSISKQISAEAIALWGVDFTVFHAGEQKESESLLLASGPLGRVDDPSYEEIEPFVKERDLFVPVMSVTSTFQDARLGLFGVLPDELNAVTLICVPRVEVGRGE